MKVNKLAALTSQLFNRLLSLLKRKTAKHAAIVVGGNFAGQALGFLATLILIRHLGPERFGMLTVAISIMGIASQLSDLGITTAFIRFASGYLKEAPGKAQALIQITLCLKTLVAITVLIVGWFISPLLATHAFHHPELGSLFRLAFVGSLGLTLWGYLQAIFQAHEWFTKYVISNIANSLFKLVAIVTLVWHGSLNELTSIAAMAIVPFFAFFLDSLFVPKSYFKFKTDHPEKKKLAWELIHFSKWITISSLCTMLLIRLDVLILQSFTNSKEVGIYGSANQLSMVFSLVATSLTTVLLPYVSSLRGLEQIRAYAKKIAKLLPFIVAGYFLIHFSSPILISLLFGEKYLPAIPVLQILAIGFSISLFLNPLGIIFLALNKPHILTILNLIQLPLLFISCLILIPHFGALGAAWGSVFIRVFAVFFTLFFLFQALKNK